MTTDCLLQVRDVSMDGATVYQFDLPMLNADVSVQDIITERVKYQLSISSREQEFPGHALIEIDEKEKLLNERLNPRRPHLERNMQKEIQKALKGFSNNSYFVIVNDAQVTSLRQRIKVTANTEVRFMKLFPLVGG